MIVEKCLCGHRKDNHDIGKFGPYCQGCGTYHSRNYKNYRHVFMLDNLKLIEDLAKEKNLI